MASASEESSSFLRRLLALVGVFISSLILLSKALILDIGSRGLLFLAANFNIFDGLFNGLFDVDLCLF
jgi:hypothetical protein